MRSLSDRKLWGLVVLKELFDTERTEYGPPVLELSREFGVSSVLLDYGELHEFSLHNQTEVEFIEALDRAFQFATENGWFARNRFGLVAPGST